ncbi:LysR family transcriptional regulator [Bacillus paranthracis]|uniref:LysR family transcriptional regulator n=1 Tax=Bacillus paranthracis TaxID=2026186 RepID=UPI003EE21976
MDIDWFRCFLLCAEQKSFSKVAEILNLTQPAVSKQIKKLEVALDVELIKRSPQGIKLTDTGQVFLQRIRPYLSDLDNMIKEIQELEGASKVNLGLLPSLAAFYLPEKLANTNKRDFHIETKVYDTSKEIANDILLGKIDAGLMEGHWATEKFWNRLLFTEPYDAVAQHSHPIQGLKDISVKNLLDEPLIMYPPDCDIRNTIIEEFRRYKKKPKIAYEVSFRDFILGMVAAGVGITIVPRTISEHIGHLPLCSVPIKDFHNTRSIYLVSRTQRIGKSLFKTLMA